MALVLRRDKGTVLTHNEVDDNFVWLDTTTVKLTGNQTIDNIKTFTSTIVGSITGNSETVTNGVYIIGNQTIAGVKTFSSTMIGSVSGNAGTVTNGVYTVGDQTIAGIKTFTSTIVGSINGNSATVTNGVYTTGSYTDPTWLTLTKTKVGLSAVDNTSDATKAVLTATKFATARTINNIPFDGTANIVIENRLGTNIASAATTNIGTVGSTSNAVHVTGVTSITSLGVSTTGITRRVIFDGALTLTYNAISLKLPGNVNLSVAIDDSATFLCEDGANGYWTCVGFEPKIVTGTEKGYLSGVTSAIQTQLNTKVSLTTNETISGLKTFSTGVIIKPQASAVPANNGEMMFELTSNTSLTIRVKGNDGTVRSAVITLA
jgi:hypothetical protein